MTCSVFFAIGLVIGIHYETFDPVNVGRFHKNHQIQEYESATNKQHVKNHEILSTIINKSVHFVQKEKPIKNFITEVNSLMHKDIINSRDLLKKSKDALRPTYLQIREADSTILGDFLCNMSAVEKCCSFYVQTVEEAKNICDAFQDICKGFVMSTMSSSIKSFQYLAYFKDNVSNMNVNFLTDFFVKTQFLPQIGWRKLLLK